jgi:hypothetical protein
MMTLQGNNLMRPSIRPRLWHSFALAAIIPHQPAFAQMSAEDRIIADRLASFEGEYLSSEGGRLLLRLPFGRAELKGTSREALPSGSPEVVTLTGRNDRPTFQGTWVSGSTTERMAGVDSDGNFLLGRSSGADLKPYMLCKGKPSDSELSFLGNGMWGKFAAARIIENAAGAKDVVVTLVVRNAYQFRRTEIGSFGMMLWTNRATYRAASYVQTSLLGSARDLRGLPAQSTVPITEMSWSECGEVPVHFRFANVTGKPERIAPLMVNTILKQWPVDLPEIASVPSSSPTTPPQTPSVPVPSPAPTSPTPPSPPPSPLPPQPAPNPQPIPPAPPGPVAEAPVPGFQPLGKWDVRLDRVENPRDDRLTHVYLTLRNAGTGTLLQTQDVWVYLEDSSGVEQRSGQGLKAQPGRPELFGSPPPVVRPGKEIRTKFVFDRNQGASPTRITVEESGKEAVFEF